MKRHRGSTEVSNALFYSQQKQYFSAPFIRVIDRTEEQIAVSDATGDQCPDIDLIDRDNQVALRPEPITSEAQFSLLLSHTMLNS